MKILFAFILCFAVYCQPVSCEAREIYARQTGQSCSACHLDPGGGGELTAAGKRFAASRASSGQAAPLNLANKMLRLLAGYLHLLTAILWFGTILYVHLVLKPAYAAGGLPRGEVRVGVISMAVMGATGALLTHYRVDSVDQLLHTRFGMLLLAKVSLYLVMVAAATFVVTVIGPKLKAKRGSSGALDGGDLTPEELASYDGKEGRPAFFAYEGKLYDATASRLWKQGVHMGRHNAGQDLTQALLLAPHGFDKVASLPEAGRLLAQASGKAPLHERVFLFMAYLNLSIVFLIVLIVSLWRWA